MFGSISPDFCFCYRSLATVDSILYLDKALLIQYALDRSQGASYARGEDTQDRVDFAGQLGTTEMNYAAPVPAFQTIRNAIFHEYAFVKAESGSPRFPEIDPRAYMAAMLEDFTQIENRAVRKQMLAVLRDNGWVGAPRARYDLAVRGYGGVLALWEVAQTLMRARDQGRPQRVSPARRRGGRAAGRAGVGLVDRLRLGGGGDRLRERASRAGARGPAITSSRSSSRPGPRARSRAGLALGRPALGLLAPPGDRALHARAQGLARAPPDLVGQTCDVGHELGRLAGPRLDGAEADELRAPGGLRDQLDELAQRDRLARGDVDRAL